MTTTIDRRAFIGSLALSSLATQIDAQPGPADVPIIDTHVHFFDPTRPQGAPYTGPRGLPPLPAYPDRYRALAVPLGAVGAVKVEASPWIEDNLWALQVSERDPIVVAVVGNLEPDKPEFAGYLDRYRKNPLFRGIRYGNLWERDILKQSANTAFIEGLTRVAAADLVLDMANPRLTLFEAAIRIHDKVPGLRIVIDHLPGFEPAASERSAYAAILKEFAARPSIFVKLSAILRRIDGAVPTDVEVYRPRLDQLLQTFGQDRILFGSDWPNSDGVAPIDQVFRIAKAYFAGQPSVVAEKYFWRNSLAAYKWTRRDSSQPSR